ncbi:Neuroligin-4, Y-linked [Frankliniella fusca]|uniref:Neuroligin-4, Y-linked n=1 Tax=Frankliniella fusca TaxID=407009 RepID=A0AAE1LFZ7_9NEOP|nr:Neuroligin-4, Y-linked [Frankliniella fusca]
MSACSAGFLNANPSPGTRARVANYGLMDQIAALHWLQQNVALFGGDPKNVTLMGHGTGAACIHFLMMSPTVTPGGVPAKVPAGLLSLKFKTTSY